MKSVNRGFIMLAILLSIWMTGLFADPAISVISESTSGISLRFELPEWTVETDPLSTGERVRIKDASYLFVEEEETLPVFSAFVAIPYSGGVELGTRLVNQDSMKNVDLGFRSLLSSKDSPNGLYPMDFVSISEPMIIRDLRVVCLTVYPFQYNSDSRELVYRQQIEISLNFNTRSAVNEISPPAQFTRSFKPIYEGQVINHSTYLTRDTNYQKPNLLVIYGYLNDAIYAAKLDEYVGWKKQLGYTVTTVSTQTTGTSSASIKSYIQNAYDTWTERPDYVVLIGDVTGSMIIPTYTENLHSGKGDYPYTFLAGDDMLGDLVIGRISVETTEQFSLYVAKLMVMERDIDAASATWLNRMLLVGDTASSGTSTIYTNRYIEDVASELHPDYTYTTLYQSGPSPTVMNAAINQGVAFFNYRGYIGMSGWGTSNINTLFNGNKLCHAVIITCSTGSFDGTATTESLVRRGTVTDMGGAITAIGMSTSSTHTSLNNCLNGGIFQGIMTQGMRDMGSALLNGKLYLNSVYGNSNPPAAEFFAHIANLIGDPTAKVYIGPPKTFNVTHVSSLPSGSSAMEVVVRNSSNELVEGASVTLVQGTTIQLLGYTNASGIAILSLPQGLSGTLILTVDQPEFKAYTASITVSSTGNLVYNSILIDDDNTGNSSGNSNGIVNPGETIELKVSLRNSSSTSIASITSELVCSDPDVTIVYARMNYSTIAAGATAMNTVAARFTVSNSCPDGHVIAFAQTGNSSLGGFSHPFSITISGGRAELISYNLPDCDMNTVEPGDISQMIFSVKNAGSLALANVNAVLRSYNELFEVSDSLASFGTIPPNQTVSNSTDSFMIRALSPSLTGMIVPLDLILTNSTGFSQVLSFSLTIGQVQITDPLGQDAYGYYIFDDGDVGSQHTPAYQWLPIAPAEGGSGTALSITDVGNSSDEGDQVGSDPIEVITLPFTFSFYGRPYNTATISSNGFIAFGETANAEFRNWRLPGALGPNPMIAVFWDDLATNSGSGIYKYYNATDHYLVIEWYDMLNGCDLSTHETFQVILYDPAYHETSTGDGPVKIQYKVFNNIDYTPTGEYSHPHGNYCTVGIKDHFGTTGLEYTYNNTYPVAAKPLTSQSALYISTRPALSLEPSLLVQNVDINDSNGNHMLESGETASLSVNISNVGSSQATNVYGTIATSDPYVTIITNSANYGSIAAFSTQGPLSGYQIQVAPYFPEGHVANFTMNITSTQGTWNGSFLLNLMAPSLNFGQMIVSETSGNHDGLVDPGEICNLIIPLQNTGLVSAQAGTATLSTSSPWIVVNTSNVSFPVLAPGSSHNVSFPVTCLASTPIGTLVNMLFSAVSGSFSTSSTIPVEVGAPLEVTIGTGTSTQTYPLDRYYNYSVHEAIYLANEINTGGQIKTIAYKKTNGGNTDPIEAVNIYMKNTTASVMTSGNYSLSGYTHVYAGTFPNTATNGWMEVNLNSLFDYDGASNLSILIVKEFQQWTSDYPYWEYSSSTTRVRQERNDNAVPTSLTASSSLPNIKLRIFPQSVLNRPLNLQAQSSNRTVYLTWNAPLGQIVPDAYKIYRNGSLLYTQNELDYYDIDVVNGNSYTYYVKAVYGTDESAASEQVQASPNNDSVQFAILGAGTNNSGNNDTNPINIYYKSCHGQSVYTAAELNAAGVFGPVSFAQIGFNVVTAPNLALPSFVIRMKHTTATNAAAWQTNTGLTTVYSNPSYMPTAGGWDMLTLTNQFSWNGTDNILVDTAFSLVANYSSSGTLQYTSIVNGYRYTRSDDADQTNIFSGGSSTDARPNVRIGRSSPASGANIGLSSPSLNFGAVEINSSATLPIVVNNSGQQTLAGRIVIPNGFSISETRTGSRILAGSQDRDSNRSELRFDIAAGSSQTFYITFNPIVESDVSVTAVFTTNAANSPVQNLPLTGSGYSQTLASPNVSVTATGNSIFLAWNSIPQATAYQVFRSLSPSGPFTLLTTVQNPNYTDSSTHRGFYYIKAIRIMSK